VKLEGKPSVVFLEEKDMSNKMTLVVRFHMDEAVKKEFTAKLQAVFTHIVKEKTFVEASLVQDMRDPRSILNESPESFMKDQMSKAYRAEFEKMIVDLKIDRTPAWYSTVADWKKA
jgi:quinol monooxygenase YgiN